ncbi:MAG: response regulator [Verrucomicrobiota bacterium]
MEPLEHLMCDNPVKTRTEVRREDALLKAGALQNAIFNNATTFYDRDRRLQGVFAVARDDTETKLHEQVPRKRNIELESARSVAEKANLAKSDFLSSMSHELRSPFNAILGFAQLRESAVPSPTDSQQESIAQILQVGGHLLKSINEILDLVVIESGKASLSPEAVSLTDMNILIVDDSPVNVLLLARMLTARGYRTRSALSGALALEVARAEAPDLILLDIAMPEMDGYQVCEQFKADAVLRDIPVIFISALRETFDKVKAFRVGGVDYVTKPFQIEEVYARVETHLRMSSLQRQLSAYNENLEQQVVERTRELTQASERLRELGGLKDDFLHMISHEIRTPANGILGIGNLVLDMCPDSEERTLLEPMFEQSCSRLLNLIEDATLLTNMTQITLGKGMARSFPEILAEVRASLPAIRISMDPSISLQTFFLKGSHPLLKKSLETVILLATSFSRDKQAVHLTGEVGEGTLRVRLELDNLSLSADQAAVFFNIESNVRSLSNAQDLGLAPVVARQIIAAFGGGLSLVKGDNDGGCLEALFAREHNPALTRRPG